MRKEFIFCDSCSKEFEIELIPMVRNFGPKWCEMCLKKADRELGNAVRRAETAQEGLERVREGVDTCRGE